VYLHVCELLLGMKLCPVSVQVTRQRLFPDEITEDLQLDAMDAERDQQNDLAVMLPGLLSGPEGSEFPRSKSAHELRRSSQGADTGGLSRARSSAGFDDEEDALEVALRTRPLDGFIDEPAMTVLVPPANPATRQHRAPFQASGISPLVQSYLQHASDTGGRQGYSLLRTTPVPWCTIGGVDTHRKKVSRAKQQVRHHRMHAMNCCAPSCSLCCLPTRHAIVVLLTHSPPCLSTAGKDYEAAAFR
jgi:hypothetical protein